MEELSLDNILGTEDIDNLFVEEDTQDSPSPDENGGETNPSKKEDKEQEDTTEVIVDNLFTDKPESVGSDQEDKEEQEDTPSKELGISPKHFYSSIAKALKEEGIFPDLDDNTYSNIEGPEDFRDLVEQQIQEGLTAKQKRIDEALNAGIEPAEISKYERTIEFLDSIEDSTITDETEKGEKIRKDLIYQDFINRGYSKERATREVQKSFNAGSDIEDAKEALKSNKEFFTDKYNELVSEAKAEAEKDKKDRKEQAEKLKSSILEDKNIFGDLSVDKSTRQRIYDNISKPIYKDPETGEYYTAIQKYEMENKVEFLKNLGLIFTLTDGFKSFDSLVKNKVKKEVKKGLRDLENTINNTARTTDGNLKFISSVNDDPESFISKGWSLDV